MFRKENRVPVPETKKKDEKQSPQYNVLLMSSLVKEVHQLLRSFFAQTIIKTKIEKNSNEPFSVSYKISVNETVNLKITVIDGSDSLLKRQTTLKYFLTRVENPILVFLFSYSDASSLSDIPNLHFKEIDQVLKEDEFHNKLSYLLIGHVDLRLSKSKILKSRSLLQQYDHIFRDRTCIEYNPKSFLNIKEIFKAINHIREDPKRKNIFPKLFKKKTLVNYILLQDKYFKETPLNEELRRSKAHLLRTGEEEDPTDSRSRLTMDDPTENDLNTSQTGLTEDDSETPSDIPDLGLTADSADNDTFSFNSELDK
jgi:hypothetical protein